MHQPKISVISPVYNVAEYVSACVESCLSQTLRDIELIFVDDGSKDDSLAVLNKLALADGRLRVFSRENAGASAARNFGLSQANGEFVFFIDSDDYIPEQTALERLYKAATANGVKIAGGSMCIDRDGKVDFDSMHGRELDSFPDERVIDYKDYQYDYDFTRYIYSLEMIRENHLAFPSLCQFEDPVFFVHAMLASERFATIPDAVYAYRYGHQHLVWSDDMIRDRVEGITQLLTVSSQLGYAKLHRYLTQQLSDEMLGAFLQNTGSDVALREMCRANGFVDGCLLQQVDSGMPSVFVIEAVRRMAFAYQRQERMKHTLIGRFLVACKHVFKRLLGR